MNSLKNPTDVVTVSIEIEKPKVRIKFPPHLYVVVKTAARWQSDLRLAPPLKACAQCFSGWRIRGVYTSLQGPSAHLLLITNI